MDCLVVKWRLLTGLMSQKQLKSVWRFVNVHQNEQHKFPIGIRWFGFIISIDNRL
jgi:hypothetical protein